MDQICGLVQCKFECFSRYRVRINYRRILQNRLFSNTWPPPRDLSLMTDASSVTKMSIPPSDGRLRRTTTSKLPSERALNRHKTVTSRKFQDTPTTVCRRGSHFPPALIYAFPRDGSSDYRTIPNVTFTVCNRHEFHDLATIPTQVMA